MFVVHESWTDMHCRVHLATCSICTAAGERTLHGQWHRGYESREEALEAAKFFAGAHHDARLWSVGLCHICCGVD